MIKAPVVALALLLVFATAACPRNVVSQRYGDGGDSDSDSDSDGDGDGDGDSAKLSCPDVFGDSALGASPGGGRSFWRLTGTVIGGKPAIVAGGYRGMVCAYDLGGVALWQAQVGSFVFSIAAGPLTAGAEPSVVVGGADGMVSAFDASGTSLWQRNMLAPVYSVQIDSVSRQVVAGGASKILRTFDASGNVTASVDVPSFISWLRVGHFEAANPNAQVMVLATNTDSDNMAYRVSVYDMPTLSTRVAQSAGIRFPETVLVQPAVADVDGDGIDDLVTNAMVWRVMLSNPSLFDAAPTIAFGDPGLAKANYDFRFRMPMVAVDDFLPAPGPETVVVSGPDVTIFGADGGVLGAARAPTGFTDVIAVPGTGANAVALLGSSPNGDETLTRVDFTDASWKATLSSLPRRNLSRDITAGITALSTAVAAAPPRASTGQAGPFTITVDESMPQNADAADRVVTESIALLAARKTQFPYDNLRFAVVFWLGEDMRDPPPPDVASWPTDERVPLIFSRAELVAYAARMEAAGAAFFLHAAHGTAPFMRASTAAMILDAAPNTCLGFISAEDEHDFEPYLRAFALPILESIKAFNTAHPTLPPRVFIFREKNVFWVSTAATPEVRDLIFPADRRYRSVIVPSVEDSNSRSPDIELAARVGLWLDGQVDRWASRLASDWFSFNRAEEFAYPMAGHPMLRYFTSQAALGASIFMMHAGEQDSTGATTRVGLEGATPFIELLGRGVVAPPLVDQLTSISPVLLEMVTPRTRFADSGENGHALSNFDASPAGDDLTPWAFSRLDCYWAMSPTASTDVSSYLWGRMRQFGNALPSTPNGYVTMLPLPPQSTRWSTTWQTDGDALWRKGSVAGSQTLATARAELAADLASTAHQLPFTTDGTVFSQVIETAPNAYVAYLIDSGLVDPERREVTLRTSLSTPLVVSDRITGAAVGMLSQSAPLTIVVPAGIFRLLDLHVQ